MDPDAQECMVQDITADDLRTIFEYAGTLIDAAFAMDELADILDDGGHDAREMLRELLDLNE